LKGRKQMREIAAFAVAALGRSQGTR
jgi:hypothetical protein